MKVIEVSQREMKRKTGFGKALGYALPDKDEILVRDDLSPEKRKEVLAHEEEHLEKGEEGPFLDFIGDIVGGFFQDRSNKRAVNAQTAAGKRELEFYRESRDLARRDQRPYRLAGYTALNALLDLTGLPRSNATPEALPAPEATPEKAKPTPKWGAIMRAMASRKDGGNTMDGEYYIVNEVGPEDRFANGRVVRSSRPTVIRPSGDGYVKPHGRWVGGVLNRLIDNRNREQSYETEREAEDRMIAEQPTYDYTMDPGYEFRRDEGLRAVERSRAARGGLLSGGTGKAIMRFGQDYASNEYQNVFNRIASIAGIGVPATNASANAALYGGSGMADASRNMGAASAYGNIATGNIWGNVIRSAGDAAQDWWKNRDSGSNKPSPPVGRSSAEWF